MGQAGGPPTRDPRALHPIYRMLCELLQSPERVIYMKRSWSLFDDEIPPRAAEIIVRTALERALDVMRRAGGAGDPE